jgi:hypothetical protein
MEVKHGSKQYLGSRGSVNITEANADLDWIGEAEKLDWRGILESNNIFRAEKQYLGAGNTESVNLLGAYGLPKSWRQRVGQHLRSRETFDILEAESQSTSWEQRES